MGYYKNPQATRERVDGDRWFHTGDFGHMDEKRHLIVIDRLADMKRLAGGHKYSPQFTEIRLRFSPYIKDAVIIGGEHHDFVTAIINIDFENVGKWAESNHISYTTFLDVSQKDEVGPAHHEGCAGREPGAAGSRENRAIHLPPQGVRCR